MNAYEAKQAERRERYQNRAATAAQQSDAAASRAQEMADVIPFGQPILIGHHSEKADRAYRARIHNTMRQAVELDKKAEHYAAKAASVGSAGISSDDPDAVAKLKNRLAALQAAQDTMKKVNAAIRRHKGDKTAQIAAVVAVEGMDERRARELLAPDFAGCIGFASYALTNNNANIRRIAARIKELDQAAQRVESERQGEGYAYREDPQENRAMFLFDSKPQKEVRETLKRNGFRWSPSRGAWVRQLTGNATWAAKRVMEYLDAQ